MNSTCTYTDIEAIKDLENCNICPRGCHTNRLAKPKGFCKTDAQFNISSICLHKGEEPVISGNHGICNVFFSHCNLQCIYCQNYQISQNGTFVSNFGTLDLITEKIITLLDRGCKSVGFVSASHMVPQMVMIINSLHRWQRFPTVVYNSNGYDSVITLKRLEGIVDVYLPDFKYSDNLIASQYSGAKDYVETAKDALKEMYRQMGSKIITDESETAVRGLIIRHLVLPNQVGNSKNVLRFIAQELSTKVSISLMAQYHPMADAVGHKSLGRTITETEYREVCEEMEMLGFENGWIQELESNKEYIPDFNQIHPFEKSA